MLVSIKQFVLFVVYMSYVVCCFSTKHDVHVVLGSADETILAERVNAAIHYVNTAKNPNILFLSGGVKNSIMNNDIMTESAKAANMMSNANIGNIQIVLDEKATNTAENFAYLKQWVKSNFSQDNFPDIVITTSDFHKNRAEQIFHGIIPDITPKWNLSKSECSQCWLDETIHIKNVKADILKAMLIM